MERKSRKKKNNRKKGTRGPAEKERPGRLILLLFLAAVVLWAFILLVDPPDEPLQRHAPAPGINDVISSVLNETPVTWPHVSEKDREIGTPENPVVSIVIDDFGYNAAEDTALLEHRLPITPSILPNLPHSRTVADAARELGYETLLHLPMDPIDQSRAEKHSIGPGMSPEEIRELIGKSLDSVGPVAGVNNHMGSLATSIPWLMEVVLEELDRRGLFFLDSLTTGASAASRAAEAKGVTILKRDIFLDNVREEDYIRGQLEALARTARLRGRAIAIGHVYPETFAAIADMLPEFEEAGIRILPLSLLHGKSSKSE